MAIVSDLAKALGIAFNLRISAAPNGEDVLIAHFMPVGCTVHDSRQWCKNINSADAFRRANPMLFRAFAFEIKQRAAKDFPVTAAADQAADAALKNQFAAVVRPRVVTSLLRAQAFLDEWRKKGLDLAVRLLEHYLSATGTDITISREVALTFELIQNAVALNTERFRERIFLSPESGKPHLKNLVAAVNSQPGATIRVDDEWKYDFDFSSVRGNVRLGLGAAEEMADKLSFNIARARSFRLGAGSSHVTSTGDFVLTREIDHVRVSGRITHVWTDEGHNFDPGGFFAEDAAILEAAGLAKPFKWSANWVDGVEGTIAYSGVPAVRARPFSRWITFSVTPALFPPQ